MRPRRRGSDAGAPVRRRSVGRSSPEGSASIPARALRPLLLGLLLLSSPLAAAEPGRSPDRVRLGLDLLSARSLSFSHSGTFREFAEDGAFSAAYVSGASPGFLATAGAHLAGPLGLELGVSRVSRPTPASWSATLPHPLYLGRPRFVGGTVAGPDLRESALRVSLTATTTRGRLTLRATAGLALTRLEATLLDGLTYAHAYPYDEVQVTGTGTVEVSATATGLELGAGADWRLAGRLAFGAQARYGATSATLAAPGAGSAEVDAGGLQVGVGLRLGL